MTLEGGWHIQAMVCPVGHIRKMTAPADGKRFTFCVPCRKAQEFKAITNIRRDAGEGN
jgi:hypothetical protein